MTTASDPDVFRRDLSANRIAGGEQGPPMSDKLQVIVEMVQARGLLVHDYVGKLTLANKYSTEADAAHAMLEMHTRILLDKMKEDRT